MKFKPGSVMSNMSAMSALSALSIDTNTDYMGPPVGFPDLVATAENCTQDSHLTSSHYFQSVDTYLITVISKLCSSSEVGLNIRKIKFQTSLNDRKRKVKGSI